MPVWRHRRPVHRQHDGLCLGGDRPRVAVFGRRAGSLVIRDKFCTAAGEMVMELVARNIRPRDIVTRKALENAATVVAASGGSTNAALHLPAIAHECGIEFDLFDVAEIFRRTPYIADLKPAGKYVTGIVLRSRRRPDADEDPARQWPSARRLPHGNRTDHCRKFEERAVECRSGRHHPAERPLSPTGGVVGLKGNLAPDGAIVKVAGLKKLQFSGVARCFNSEEECFEAVEKLAYKDGDVLVIRYEGPRGGPACARCFRRQPLCMDKASREGRLDHGSPFLRRDARFLHWPRRPRQRKAGRSACCATVTSSTSMPRPARCRFDWMRKNWQRGRRHGSRAGHSSGAGHSGNMPNRWVGT